MYEYKTIVGPSAAGADGLQTLVSTITMMQDCSQLWELSEPEFMEWLKDENATMIITSRQLEILRRPACYENLSVQTRIYEAKGYLGFRNTFIYDERGEAVAKSWGVGAFISLETGKLLKPAEKVNKAMVIEPKLDMNYLSKKIKKPEGDPKIYPAFTAFRSDIDFNKHVNNAQYVRMSMEYLPEGFQPTNMRIEYKSQCRVGQTLTPHVYEVENGYYVSLVDSEGNPYTNTEFTA